MHLLSSFPWSRCTVSLILTSSIKVRDSQALVLDAGHISVESNLANKEQLKEVQSKRGRQYDDDDFKQLEGLMYDKFSLQLESTQVSRPRRAGLTLALDGSKRRSMHVSNRKPSALHRIGITHSRAYQHVFLGAKRYPECAKSHPIQDRWRSARAPGQLFG